MATTITIDNVNQTLNQTVISGTIALTGNYGGASTHGDTLSFLNQDSIKSGSAPVQVRVFETPPAGTSASGFEFSFSPGSDQGNGVLQVFGSAATAGANTPGSEYTQAAAYNAALLAAVLKFQAFFPRL
jgi:hypothetical protein